MTAHKQLPWMKDLAVGDVLWNRSRTDARVVRSVQRYKNGDLSSVTLAIRRCSWTNRPLTTLNYTDLIFRGYERAPLRVKLDRAIDRDLEHHVDVRNAVTITCCDVKGVP